MMHSENVRSEGKHLLMVGVGLMGRAYVHAARRLGVRVSAVETAANAATASELVDRVFLVEGDSDESWAAAAYLAAEELMPDGVIAFSEPHVLGAALVQEGLGLPGPSLHAAVLSRNKALQRGRFAARSLRQPDYLIVGSLTAAREWAELRLPVVVKALSSAGSDGVELVADLPALNAVCARRAHESPLLVEAAVEGPEYSWEGLIRDGEILFDNTTEKETTGPPDFVETCHRSAAPLTPAVAEEVDRLAAGVVSALGMETGLVHLEFRLATQGPTIIEVAVRTPGDFIMDTLGLTYGFDWFESVVRLALGLPASVRARGGAAKAYAASVFLLAEPGVTVGIEGLETARRHPAVTAAGLDVDLGDLVRETRSSHDRVGWALLHAATREELEAALRFVRSTIRVETRRTRVARRASVAQ